jgi:hypothetical protein
VGWSPDLVVLHKSVLPHLTLKAFNTTAQGRDKASFTSLAAALGKLSTSAPALKGRNNWRYVDKFGTCCALSGLGIILFRFPRAAQTFVELANCLPWADV